MRKMMIIGVCVCFLLAGCSKSEPGKLVNLKVAQLQTKIEKKETFPVLFTQPTCAYCKKVKTMLDSYLKDHKVTLYEVSIDRTTYSDKDYKKLLEDIRKTFPMEGTPDLYYVKDGKIVNQFDADNVDLDVENNFHEWVETYNLLEKAK